LIESEVGTIDARLETQLRVLERALLSQSEGEGSQD
jgi:flagellar biosynthesis/type III secretory pathway protein FliH